MASVAATGKAGLELVQTLFSQRITAGGFNRLLNNVKITSAEDGLLKATMTVDKEHANIGGTLHGGMTAFLVDSLSSLALATCPGVKNTGVSLNLNVSFIKAAAVGQEIEIISRADKAGGRVAFLSVDIVDKNTGDLIAKGSHTKLTAINRPASEVNTDTKAPGVQ